MGYSMKLLKQKYKRKLADKDEVIRAKEKSIKVHIKEIDNIRKENNRLKVLIGEAYNDGFGDDIHQFDLENYI